MDITVEIRDVYGIRTVYPACQTAKLFARLAGTKTLTSHAIDTIKQLGYSINIAQKEVQL